MTCLLTEECKTCFLKDCMHSDSFSHTLKQYSELLSNLYGPYGKAVLIENSAGATSVATSVSQLLSQLQFSHPVIKFINELILSQISAYSSYGLFVGVLVSKLLFNYIKCEEVLSASNSAAIFTHIFSDVWNMIQESQDDLRFPVDLGRTGDLLKFVSTILDSKAGHFLSSYEKNILNAKICHCFIETFPVNGSAHYFGQVHITTHIGSDTSTAQVLKGILLPFPEFIEWPLSDAVSCGENMKIILFNLTLNKFNLEGAQMQNLIFVQLIKVLVELNIKIVMNQKVFDEGLKFELRKQGIFAVDRLGKSKTETLMRMLGCAPVTKLSDISNPIIGTVKSLKEISLYGRTFLQLEGSCTDVTLFLPGISEHIVDTIKEMVETSVSLLRCLAVNPFVVKGAGCLEIWLAYLIASRTEVELDNICELLNVSKREVISVCSMIVCALCDTAQQLTKKMVAKHCESGDLASSYCTGKEILKMCVTAHEATMKSKRNVDVSVHLSSLHFKELYMYIFDAASLLQLVDSGDHFSAKLNAVSIVFEGFLLLKDVGCCIFSL